MKTTNDVLDILFPIVNVAGVQATLDGAVYRESRPVNSTTRDVTLKALPITGGQDIDLQRCTVMINCFATDLQAGRPDEANLAAITRAVISVLEAYAATAIFFDIEIASQTTFKDADQAGIHYSSLRLECTIQFNS